MMSNKIDDFLASADLAQSQAAADLPTATDAEPEESVTQLLEQLRLLDDQTDALDALPPMDVNEEEPDWLIQAADMASKHISELPAAPLTPLAPALPTVCRERAVTWDERAATVQFEMMQSDSAPNMDAGALAWIDAQLVPIVARSFPHLARLVTTPDFDAEDNSEEYARELLRKRDALLLRKRQSDAHVKQRVAVKAMSSDLRQEETEAHLLRVATVKQARDQQALRDQLDATKEVAKATSMAARTIFDDHAADVKFLLGELAKVNPLLAAGAETKLSASQSQLHARKRHAQAEQKLAGKSERQLNRQATDKKVRSFSFQRLRGKSGKHLDAAGGAHEPEPPEADEELSIERVTQGVKDVVGDVAQGVADVAEGVAGHVESGVQEVTRAVRSLSFKLRRQPTTPANVAQAAVEKLTPGGGIDADWEHC